jgi:hypothetical protein
MCRFGTGRDVYKRDREEAMLKHILPAVSALAFLFVGTGISFAQDLMIQIQNCPQSAKAGQDLSASFQVAVTNEGKAAVKDVEVAIVMKKNALCPPPGRPAVYSPDFFDGVLLRDGRQYVSLDPGQTVTVQLYGANTIPANIPIGRTYYLCAVIAAGVKEKEGKDKGTCACCPVKIIGTESRAVVSGLAESCATRRGTVTILGSNFGSGAAKVVVLGGAGLNLDLTVISWGDNAIVARIPDDARIQDTQQYHVSIQRADHTEVLSNRQYIGICPALQLPKSPTPVQPPPPVPPFLY